MKNSFIFIAEGFEEIEATTTLDVLRRAGIEVYSISITQSNEVKGTHGMRFLTDLIFDDCDFSDTDWLILPGGMPGASNLAAYAPLNELLIKHNAEKGRIAAICASPAVVLAPLGIIDKKEAVCYPGFENCMKDAKTGYKPVVVDENIITANGPAAAMQFSLSIASQTIGEENARNIAEDLLLYEQHHEYYF